MKLRLWNQQGCYSCLDANGVAIHELGVHKYLPAQDGHEIWIERGECYDKELQNIFLAADVNVVLVTNNQNLHMTAAMHRQCMNYKLRIVGWDAVDEWLNKMRDLGWKDSSTAREIYARKGAVGRA